MNLVRGKLSNQDSTVLYYAAILRINIKENKTHEKMAEIFKLLINHNGLKHDIKPVLNIAFYIRKMQCPIVAPNKQDRKSVV